MSTLIDNAAALFRKHGDPHGPRPPIDDADIATIERECGFTLPRSYALLLKRCNGGYLIREKEISFTRAGKHQQAEIRSFQYHNHGTRFGSLLELYRSIRDLDDCPRPRLPERTLAFASSQYRHFFVFHAPRHLPEPRICVINPYADQEYAECEIEEDELLEAQRAQTFDEFLFKLTSP